jgi:ABC-type dipeptide/oligopeptide/nickel transport system permease subunit
MRNREFVQACVSMGMSNARIILAHVLPNTLSPIIVTGSLMVATAILIESGLSFLGLSDPNVMSWGLIIGAGYGAAHRMVGVRDSRDRDTGDGDGHQPGRRGTQRCP